MLSLLKIVDMIEFLNEVDIEGVLVIMIMVDCKIVMCEDIV